MKKTKPFWELNLNPITMEEPVRYSKEQSKQMYEDAYPTLGHNTAQAQNVRNQLSYQQLPQT